MKRTLFFTTVVLMIMLSSCSKSDTEDNNPTENSLVGHWISQDVGVVHEDDHSKTTITKPLELRLYNDGQATIALGYDREIYNTTIRFNMNNTNATYKVMGKELDIITDKTLYAFDIEAFDGSRMVLFWEDLPTKDNGYSFTMLKK